MKPQFRKLCSLVARRYHWSKRNYSPPELKIKRVLEKYGLVEGRDFSHNTRIRYSNKVSYYPDFIVYNKYIIEYCPSVWHKRYWGMDEKYKRRKERLKALGYIVFDVESEEGLEEKVEQIIRRIISHEKSRSG